MALAPGVRVGAYEVLSLLGRGGMGEVYRARDTRLGRIVALKVLLSGGPDAEGRARLEREARAISSLDHPNICALYDIGRDGDISYLVMQYLEGETLARRLQRGAMPLDEARHCAREIAMALATAHAHGIVHRDLKPGNVMLTASGAKLLDFGLAVSRQRFDDDTATTASEAPTAALTPALDGVTRTGTILGTPHYMAPEQIRGERGDVRSDIFAFGAVFYEMVTGRRAVEGRGDAGIITTILSVDPPPPHQVAAHVPVALSALIMSCLAKVPADRPQSMRDVAEALRPPAPQPTRGDASYAGSRFSIGAALLVAAILALGGYLYGQRQRAVPVAPPDITLAVLPVQAAGLDAAAAAYWTGLLDSVANRLAALPASYRLNVVPSADLVARAARTPEDAGIEVGATRVLTASPGPEAGDPLTLVLVDAGSGEVVNRRSVIASRTDAPAAQRAMTEAILSLLGLRLTEAERVRFAVPSTAAGAYDFYVQGMGYLLDYDRPEQVDTAIVVLERALALDANYALAHAGLGQAFWRKYLATRDPVWAERARQSCERALGRDEGESAPHTCLGTVANGTGQYEKAIEEYEHALERESASSLALLGLANAYRALGDVAQAERAYKQAIAARPGYWASYSNLGVLYFTAGRYPEAEEMFRQVIALAPDSWRAFSNLGALLYSQDRFDEAVVAFERSLAIRPNYQAASNLGTLYYFEQQNYAKAAQAFKQALSINETEYVLWGNYASALRWSGDTQAARGAYREAAVRAEARLRVNPRDPMVMVDLAEYYGGSGRDAEARRLVDQALALAPTEAGAWYTAGVLYEFLGERDLAVKTLARALELGYRWRELERSPSLRALREGTAFGDLRKQAERRVAPQG